MLHSYLLIGRSLSTECQVVAKVGCLAKPSKSPLVLPAVKVSSQTALHGADALGDTSAHLDVNGELHRLRWFFPELWWNIRLEDQSNMSILRSNIKT
jgi:hypothetical protein